MREKAFGRIWHPCIIIKTTPSRIIQSTVTKSISKNYNYYTGQENAKPGWPVWLLLFNILQ